MKGLTTSLSVLFVLTISTFEVSCAPRPQNRDGGSFTSDILRALQRRNGLTTISANAPRRFDNTQQQQVANNARSYAVQQPASLSARALLPRQASYGSSGDSGYGGGGGGGYGSGSGVGSYGVGQGDYGGGALNQAQQYLFYAYPRAQTAYAALSQAAKPIPQLYNPCLYYLKSNNQTGLGLDGDCGDPIPYNLTAQRPLEPRSDLFGYPNYYIPKHFIPLGYGSKHEGIGYGTYEGGGYGNNTKSKKLFYFNYPPKPEYREPEADIYGYPGFYVPKIFVPHGFGVYDDGSFANSQNYTSNSYGSGGGYGNVPARQSSLGYGGGGGAGNFGVANNAGYGGGGGYGGGTYGGGAGAGYGGVGYSGAATGGGGNALYGSGLNGIPSRQMGMK